MGHQKDISFALSLLHCLRKWMIPNELKIYFGDWPNLDELQKWATQKDIPFALSP